jgi:RNA polymerase sigma-70 factor (ECF subfamily)
VSEEKVLFDNIKKGDLHSFEILFHQYYGLLCSFAEKITKNSAVAEEIVQEFFVRLWEKRTQINIETSVKSYFYQSVKNLCLNYIQHQKIKEKHHLVIQSEHESVNNLEDAFLEIDLADKIEQSILSLPEKRREIFKLSRESGLKYHEIAKKLNISIKTVEAQMNLAIKHLRNKLKDYITLLLIILYLLK